MKVSSLCEEAMHEKRKSGGSDASPMCCAATLEEKLGAWYSSFKLLRDGETSSKHHQRS